MTDLDLQTLRKKAGLTQQQLADLARTTQVTIARYETGVRPIPEPMALLFTLLLEKK